MRVQTYVTYVGLEIKPRLSAINSVEKSDIGENCF